VALVAGIAAAGLIGFGRLELAAACGVLLALSLLPVRPLHLRRR
jgi:hypothetical protein